MHSLLFFLGKVLTSIGLLLLFVISSYGWGASLARLIKIKTPYQAENHFYSIIIGMGIIGHLVLIFGLSKLLYPLTAIFLLTGGIILTALHAWKQKASIILFISKHKFHPRISWFQAALVILILINIGYSFLANVLIPPLSVDEVAYHMAAPKIYTNHHSLIYLSTIPHTNWPFETEMLFTFGLLLSSETFAHLVTWVSLIFSCFSFFLFMRKYFKEYTGLIAAVIFSSTPVVLTIAGIGLIELPLTLYIVLATITMIDWFESGDRSYFILSAIFGGLAASTKLNAAFIPVILGVCYVFHSVFVRHNSITKVIKQFILYGLISFLIVLPWYLKAWYQTGNPFWPFLWNILGGKNWDELGSQYFFNFIKSPNLPLSVKNWIQALWVLTAHPSSYGSAGFELNWLYLSLLPFSILALFFYKTKYRQVFIWLGIIALALYTLWFLQTHQIRFLMPVIGIFSLLIAIGITWFIELKNWKWNFLWSLIFILYLLSASWIMKPSYRGQILDNHAYLTGKISRNQYLEQHNQGYKVFEYANANLPPDALIWLALYEVRGYYLDRDYLWANPISQRVIPLEQFQDADQLVAELSELGISYILLQTSTIDTYSDIEYGTHYSNLIRSLVEQHGQLEYSDTQEELYKLTP